VQALQSIAQAGLTYAEDPYDIARYRQVRHLAAEIAAGQTGGRGEAIEDLFAAARGYPTPKLDVRAAVIVEGRILLVEERDGGGWSLPGGWADVGESAAEAVVRETREEAGVDVDATKLIALLDRARHGHPHHPEYSLKAFFACRLRGPVAPAGSDVAPTGGDETTAAGFFARTSLPPLSVARVTPAQIEMAFAHHAEPGLPTEFD
jgi:ADP-ribose pyrophosphatase YjhB (NUDIX family)